MNWFEEDPFEGILKEFFGESSRTKNYKDNLLETEEDERLIDYSEDEKNIYFVFELPGYTENDVDIAVKNGRINISASKKDTGDVQSYLSEKLSRGIILNKKLPKFIKFKKFSYTLKNGVLEIIFRKK